MQATNLHWNDQMLKPGAAPRVNTGERQAFSRVSCCTPQSHSQVRDKSLSLEPRFIFPLFFPNNLICQHAKLIICRLAFSNTIDSQLIRRDEAATEAD